MILSDLMSSVISEIRPSGLPDEAEMDNMTDAQIKALHAEQSEIIRVFRARAEIQISLLREQMDNLLAISNNKTGVPKLTITSPSAKNLPKICEPRTARNPTEPRNPNPRTKQIAQIPHTPRIPKPAFRPRKPPFRL